MRYLWLAVILLGCNVPARPCGELGHPVELGGMAVGCEFPGDQAVAVLQVAKEAAVADFGPTGVEWVRCLPSGYCQVKPRLGVVVEMRCSKTCQPIRY